MNHTMHSVNVVLIVLCVVNVEFARSQNPEAPASYEYKESQLTENDVLNDHTFVALIDIVFTDGSKRTCTGSIIQDTVVITAAHCFTKENIPDVKPELTASFVVIGSKKMFDTGYEQYFPIERVLTHPKFSGWTADLSLVYTFAGMVSDKPGLIIPLAGEKTSTHVDSNVTVMSWGHMRSTEAVNDWSESKPTSKKDDKACADSASQEDDEKKHHQNNNNKMVTAYLQSRNGHRSNHEIASIALIHNGESMFPTERNPSQTQNSVRQKTQNKLASFRVGSQNTKLISRYLSRQGRINFRSSNIHQHSTTLQGAETLQNKEAMISDEEIMDSNYDISTHNHSVTNPNLDSGMDTFKSYYKNWRRQMGSQQNQLTVETFGFVNVQACKKLVEKAMPSRFDISGANDVVCYAAEDHFISDEDSGAPAVRRGQLIAVTVGGAEIDGDHVAVGMKISCYCSWIADNLPNEVRPYLDCCKNCCNVKHKEEPKKNLRHKNKHAYRKF